MPRVPSGLHRKEGQRLHGTRAQDVEAAGSAGRGISRRTQCRPPLLCEASAEEPLPDPGSLQLLQPGHRAHIQVRKVPRRRRHSGSDRHDAEGFRVNASPIMRAAPASQCFKEERAGLLRARTAMRRPDTFGIVPAHPKPGALVVAIHLVRAGL